MRQVGHLPEVMSRCTVSKILKKTKLNVKGQSCHSKTVAETRLRKTILESVLEIETHSVLLTRVWFLQEITGQNYF